MISEQTARELLLLIFDEGNVCSYCGRRFPFSGKKKYCSYNCAKKDWESRKGSSSWRDSTSRENTQTATSSCFGFSRDTNQAF